jgi:DNA polymerase-1
MRLILVDGSGYIFRAFYALPPLDAPDGTPCNAVYGFTSMLSRTLGSHTGTHFAVIFDAARRTFRHEIYDQYKANRSPTPDALRPQMPLIREAVRACGVPSIELVGWEADDLIAAYCRAATEQGGSAIVVSSDKDLMQLLRPGVELLDPLKYRPIETADVVAKFGVLPEQLIDLQALIGDKVDNVPGVAGIGPKHAARLILEYGDLDAVLDAAPDMKPSAVRAALIAQADQARLSRELVRLRDDAPLPLPLDALAAREPDPDKLRAWLARMGFVTLIEQFGLAQAA